PSTRNFFTADTVAVNRRPIAVITGDTDGDGRYEGMSADGSPAPTASVLTNIRGNGFLRGDGNGDGRVSAADAVAVMRKAKDMNGMHAEDAPSRGTYVAQIAVDANGDGIITPQDVFAVAFRVFNPSFAGL
ncbi:MAG TPA: dockerin type I domain-containing protein, partial [Candidatus Acidoferrales bacterium]|nr:dockerin type I domain-containing protein [Candidatus Acidoferrales bacterium]